MRRSLSLPLVLGLAASAAGAQPVTQWWTAVGGPPVDASATPACDYPPITSRAIVPDGTGGAWLLGKAFLGSYRQILLWISPQGGAKLVDVLPDEYTTGPYALIRTGSGVAASGTRSHWNGTTTEIDTWVGAWDADGRRRLLSVVDVAQGAADGGSALAAGPAGSFYGASSRMIGGQSSAVLFQLTSGGELLWTRDLPGEQIRGLTALPDGSVALASDNGAGPRVLFFSADGVPVGVASVATDAGRDETLSSLVAGPGNRLAVTGSSCLAGACEALAALIENGATTWSRRVLPPATGSSRGSAVALDAAGRVFIAGSQLTAPAPPRMLVAALSAQGELLWSDGTLGGSGYNNFARAVALAPDGDVIAAGSTQQSGHYTDYLLARYEPASGQRTWTATLDSGAGRPDDACDLGIDPASGRVLVTGTAARSTNDIWTVALDPGGQVVWETVEPPLGPSSQSVGDPSEPEIGSHALAVEANGGVLFVGSESLDAGFAGIAGRLDPSGNLSWLASFPGDDTVGRRPTLRAVAPASGGTVYVAGRGDDPAGFFTAAIAAAGHPLWSRSIPVGDGDGANAIAALPSGGVVVTGEQRNAGGNFDALTVGYDGDGNELWRAVLDEFSESGVDLALLAGDRVAVLADVDLPGGPPSLQCTVVTYDLAGVEVWRRDLLSLGGAGTRCRALAPDSTGGVFVGGESAMRPMVARLTADGAVEWRALDPSAVAGADVLALAPLPDGGVAAAGEALVGSHAAAWIGRFSPGGDLLWSHVEPAPDWGTAVFHDLGIDPGGEIHALAWVEASGEDPHFEIRSYAADGNSLATVSSADIVAARITDSLALAVAPGGRLVAASTADTPATATDALVVSFALPALFADGFESGDTTRWSASEP